MSKAEPQPFFWAKVWIEFVAGVILIISIFSLFSLMRAGGWIGFSIGLSWIVFRVSTSGLRFSLNEAKESRLFSILAVLCFVSLVIRPHSFLDSYSYRIPQMLLWLQEGHPWFVSNADFRINQMPHVWPFLSAVFYLPFGERGIAIPNFISLLILFGVLKAFAAAACRESRKVGWMLLIFMSSPVVVMQAASNDNTLTCVTFLIISAGFALLQKPSAANTSYSALAFAICCGIKPQYVTLAPLWLIWFFSGWSAPWRSFRWRALVWLIPLLLICSPVPTLTANYLLNGSVTRPEVADLENSRTQTSDDIVEERASMPKRLAHSYSCLIEQLFAFPVNPLAGKLTAGMKKTAAAVPALQWLDWHRLKIYPLLIEERASLSFFATLALIAGLIRSGRSSPRNYAWLFAGSLLCMMLAILFTTPGSLGRSFVGFILLMLPLAFSGLLKFRRPVLAAWGIGCFCIGVFVVIINPAAPLWPVRMVVGHLPASALKTEIQKYGQFADRIYSGSDLLALVPAEEKTVGGIFSRGEPLVELWKPYATGRKVRLYAPTVTIEQLKRDKVSFLLIKHPDLISSGKLNADFLSDAGGRAVVQMEYTSYTQKGAEPWFLVSILP